MTTKIKADIGTFNNVISDELNILGNTTNLSWSSIYKHPDINLLDETHTARISSSLNGFKGVLSSKTYVAGSDKTDVRMSVLEGEFIRVGLVESGSSLTADSYTTAIEVPVIKDTFLYLYLFEDHFLVNYEGEEFKVDITSLAGKTCHVLLQGLPGTPGWAFTINNLSTFKIRFEGGITVFDASSVSGETGDIKFINAKTVNLGATPISINSITGGENVDFYVRDFTTNSGLTVESGTGNVIIDNLIATDDITPRDESRVTIRGGVKIETNNGALALPTLTQGQVDGLLPEAGMIIYNSSISRLQMFYNNSWFIVGNQQLFQATLNNTNDNETLLPFREYFIDSTLSTLTFTLPENSSTGTHIRILDVSGTFDNNNVTILPFAGDTIEDASQYILNEEYDTYDLYYSEDVKRWSVSGHKSLDFIGATPGSEGVGGVVPKPGTASQDHVLFASGQFKQIVQTWTPATSYSNGALVVYRGELYRKQTAEQSSDTFDEDKWNRIGFMLTEALVGGSTLLINSMYQADTSLAALSVSLPETAPNGSKITIVDSKSSFESYPLEVKTGSLTQQIGDTDPGLSISLQNKGVYCFIYDRAQDKWTYVQYGDVISVSTSSVAGEIPVFSKSDGKTLVSSEIVLDNLISEKLSRDGNLPMLGELDMNTNNIDNATTVFGNTTLTLTSDKLNDSNIVLTATGVEIKKAITVNGDITPANPDSISIGSNAFPFLEVTSNILTANTANLAAISSADTLTETVVNVRTMVASSYDITGAMVMNNDVDVKTDLTVGGAITTPSVNATNVAVSNNITVGTNVPGTGNISVGNNVMVTGNITANAATIANDLEAADINVSNNVNILNELNVGSNTTLANTTVQGILTSSTVVANTGDVKTLTVTDGAVGVDNSVLEVKGDTKLNTASAASVVVSGDSTLNAFTANTGDVKTLTVTDGAVGVDASVLEVKGDTKLNTASAASVNVSGNITCNGNLICNGDIENVNFLTISNTATLPTIIAQDVTCTGTAELNDLNVGGTVEVLGAFTLNTLAVDGTSVFTGSITSDAITSSSLIEADSMQATRTDAGSLMASDVVFNDKLVSNRSITVTDSVELDEAKTFLGRTSGITLSEANSRIEFENTTFIKLAELFLNTSWKKVTTELFLNGITGEDISFGIFTDLSVAPAVNNLSDVYANHADFDNHQYMSVVIKPGNNLCTVFTKEKDGTVASSNIAVNSFAGTTLRFTYTRISGNKISMELYHRVPDTYVKLYSGFIISDAGIPYKLHLMDNSTQVSTADITCISNTAWLYGDGESKGNTWIQSDTIYSTNLVVDSITVRDIVDPFDTIPEEFTNINTNTISVAVSATIATVEAGNVNTVGLTAESGEVVLTSITATTELKSDTLAPRTGDVISAGSNTIDAGTFNASSEVRTYVISSAGAAVGFDGKNVDNIDTISAFNASISDTLTGEDVVVNNTLDCKGESQFTGRMEVKNDFVTTDSGFIYSNDAVFTYIFQYPNNTEVTASGAVTTFTDNTNAKMTAINYQMVETWERINCEFKVTTSSAGDLCLGLCSTDFRLSANLNLVNNDSTYYYYPPVNVNTNTVTYYTNDDYDTVEETKTTKFAKQTVTGQTHGNGDYIFKTNSTQANDRSFVRLFGTDSGSYFTWGGVYNSTNGFPGGGSGGPTDGPYVQITTPSVIFLKALMMGDTSINKMSVFGSNDGGSTLEFIKTFNNFSISSNTILEIGSTVGYNTYRFHLNQNSPGDSAGLVKHMQLIASTVGGQTINNNSTVALLKFNPTPVECVYRDINGEIRSISLLDKYQTSIINKIIRLEYIRLTLNRIKIIFYAKDLVEDPFDRKFDVNIPYKSEVIRRVVPIIADLSTIQSTHVVETQKVEYYYTNGGGARGSSYIQRDEASFPVLDVGVLRVKDIEYVNNPSATFDTIECTTLSADNVQTFSNITTFGTVITPNIGDGNSINFNASDVSNIKDLSVNGFLSNTGGAKLVIQNWSSGGTEHGIYWWNSNNTNWVSYMAQSGNNRSPTGGVACLGAGFSHHAIRMRVANSDNNGFILENSSEACNFSCRGSDGLAYFRGKVLIGTTDSTGNNALKVGGNIEATGNVTANAIQSVTIDTSTLTATDSVVTNTITSSPGNDISFSGSSLTTIGSLTMSGFLSNTGGAKLEIQNGFSGGTDHGIYWWTTDNTNWVSYMAQSGNNRSPTGGVACLGAGFSHHAIRMRVANSDTNGFILENSSEACNFSCRGSDGLAYFRGKVLIGTTDSTGNALLKVEGNIKCSVLVTNYITSAAGGNINFNGNDLINVGSLALNNFSIDSLTIDSISAASDGTVSFSGSTINNVNVVNASSIVSNTIMATTNGGTINFSNTNINTRNVTISSGFALNTQTITSATANISFSNKNLTSIAELTVSGFLSNTGGAKLEIQNGSSGGSNRGIYWWHSNNTDWVSYMAESGNNKSPTGGDACSGAGFSHHAIRMRVADNNTNGFIIENSSEACNFSCRGSDGLAYFRGKVLIGTTSNTGNALQVGGDIEATGKVKASNVLISEHLANIGETSSASITDVIAKTLGTRSHVISHRYSANKASLGYLGTPGFRIITIRSNIVRPASYFTRLNVTVTFTSRMTGGTGTDSITNPYIQLNNGNFNRSLTSHPDDTYLAGRGNSCSTTLFADLNPAYADETLKCDLYVNFNTDDAFTLTCLIKLHWH